MTCACGNAARYINELGELCCGICPIKQGLDSIKLASVPEMIKLARLFIESPTCKTNDLRVVQKMSELIGRKP